jgi:hypothetical protein
VGVVTGADGVPSKRKKSNKLLIESAMGVVTGADGVPSCLVKASDGNVWVNWWDGTARVWTGRVPGV